jgi:glycosyltransferase involved in cell wall biosynthesis
VPGAELLVAGGTGPRDPDLERLRSLAETHGVADRVRLLGPVARAELPALIRSADAVVCVPWYEPFGMVALEAMACGRPVVASAVGGLTDTVIDRMTGIHIPPRDHRALATALRSLLRSPILAHAYGVAGRDRAIARYSWDRVAAETALQYSRLVPAVTGRLASVAT